MGLNEKMKDALGNRMKEYEAVTKYKLLRRGYTMIRIDGKAFHTWTKGCQRPFDQTLINCMFESAKQVAKFDMSKVKL